MVTPPCNTTAQRHGGREAPAAGYAQRGERRARLIIDGVSRQVAGLSGNGDGKPAAQEDHPAPAGT
jgi:hypothetical protein